MIRENNEHLTALVTAIEKSLKYFRREDYRSIGETMIRDNPEGVEEMIRVLAQDRDMAKLMIEQLKKYQPDLFQKTEIKSKKLKS